MVGAMKHILVGGVAVVLASCAAPQGNNVLQKWSQPIVMWEGIEATTLPMETVTMDGRLVFFVVELSINGNRESFLVDSGCSSTSFTDAFVRTLKAKISVGQREPSSTARIPSPCCWAMEMDPLRPGSRSPCKSVAFPPMCRISSSEMSM